MQDVAVVGYPDPVLVERGCACVVVSGPVTPTVAELRDRVVAAGLAVQKAPELLYVLPSPQSTETASYIDYAVNTLKAKKVAMLYQNDGWGKPAYDVAVKQLEKHGMKLVEAQSFERFATDLTS